MSWTRWRQVAGYLVWLPPVVLLCVSGTYPILPSGDRRNGTWQDPREFTGELAIYYLMALVIFRLGRRLIRARRAVTNRNRRSKGQCVACGYDLRQTPDRCPECGMEVRVTPVGLDQLRPGRPARLRDGR